MKTVSFLLGAGAVLVFQGIAWCAGGGAQDGGHGLNWFDFALRTGNFAILAFILYKLLSKPISNFLVSRREDIQKLLADLEAKRREAEEVSAQYRARLAALDVETRKIVDELLAEGESEKSKILAAAEKQAEYIRQQAQLAAQQEVKVARDKLQEEIAELSIAAAEEILRKKIKADDQDRLVKDFMTRVVEAK
ncbi:MAG: F0F1 ATP synthase subunit B [Syntrophobacteraceae bacterium]|nr:F0F1 ATP synthase subunit B [Syntrophobacteraceae bacterium]